MCKYSLSIFYTVGGVVFRFYCNCINYLIFRRIVVVIVGIGRRIGGGGRGRS